MTVDTTQLDNEKDQQHISTRQDDSSNFTPEEWALDRSCVRKLDFTMLPLTALIYFFSFLDRSNLGNARVAGLQADLGLTSHQYLVCVTCTYVLYIAAELPSNLLLKIVGPHILIPGMVLLWGIVCCLTGLVSSYPGLIVARLALGLCEGGVFPGLVLYLSSFYRRREMQVRISLFFSAASLSGAFSGLLAAAIVKMNGVGGQAGWRWIFYLEGLLTIIFAASLFYFFPGTPNDSRFLSPEQKAHIQRRLALDNPPGAGVEPPFSWGEVRKAFTSPHVLLLAVALFGNGVTLYAFGYFTPSIVQTLGYSPTRTQLMTVPPFAVAFFVTMLSAWLSDKYGRRSLSVMAMSVLALAGYLMFLNSSVKNVRYGSLFLSIPGIYGTAPALTTWVPNNSAGHVRRATAVAMGFIMTNSGGILSTWLFPTSEGPSYRRATIVSLSMCIMTGVFAALNLAYLVRKNKEKARVQNPSAETWFEEGDKHASYKYTY